MALNYTPRQLQWLSHRLLMVILTFSFEKEIWTTPLHPRPKGRSLSQQPKVGPCSCQLFRGVWPVLLVFSRTNYSLSIVWAQEESIRIRGLRVLQVSVISIWFVLTEGENKCSWAKRIIDGIVCFRTKGQSNNGPIYGPSLV